MNLFASLSRKRQIRKAKKVEEFKLKILALAVDALRFLDERQKAKGMRRYERKVFWTRFHKNPTVRLDEINEVLEGIEVNKNLLRRFKI